MERLRRGLPLSRLEAAQMAGCFCKSAVSLLLNYCLLCWHERAFILCIIIDSSWKHYWEQSGELSSDAVSASNFSWIWVLWTSVFSSKKCKWKHCETTWLYWCHNNKRDCFILMDHINFSYDLSYHIHYILWICLSSVFLTEPKASRWRQLPPLYQFQALGIWKSIVIYSSGWKLPTHIIPCQLTKVRWCMNKEATHILVCWVEHTFPCFILTVGC